MMVGSFEYFISKQYCLFVLGSTKYNVEASAEKEKERMDEWHRFLTEDGDDDD